ncbi:MAG TPA: TetR family transcriptional regulator, partial [Ktedonobacteraceae bacterium]|nr:TetR family transcriptional regulator [Ktedonobacteraceae bacterium]
EAATDIFAKQGYEDTTIAQIAAAAGVAVGTVYLYFHNKREIYTQSSVNWTERLALALQDPRILSLPVEQVPRAMIETVFRLCHENSNMMSVFQVDIQSAEELQQHKEADGAVTGAVDSFLRSAIENGQLAPFDTTTYAKILFGMVHSALFECFCVQKGHNEDTIRESTIEIVERLFFGPPLAFVQRTVFEQGEKGAN